MTCNIDYITKTTYSPKVKNKLVSEHKTIFDTLAKTGKFNSFNRNGKQGLYIADPSSVSTLRQIQLEAIADVNKSYPSEVVSVGSLSNGKNVVQVNVLPLADSIASELSPLRQVLNPDWFRERTVLDALEEDESANELRVSEGYALSPEQDTLVRLLDKLKAKTGIPYQLVNDPLKNIGGRFRSVNGVPTVEINLAKASEKTTVHEYLHPFVLAVRQDRPDLYYSLLGEIIKNHQDTIKEVEALGYDSDSVLEEAMVRVLTEYASQENRPSIIEDFFLWLQDFISWITGVKYPLLGKDLNLKKLSQEFTGADTLHDQLAVVRQMKDVQEEFEILDEQFTSVVRNQKFRELIESVGNKINLFRSLVKDKPQLFSSSYLSQLQDVEQFINQIKENAKGEVNESAMVASLLNYVSMASMQSKKIREDFLATGGIFDQINNHIQNNSKDENYHTQLNEYLKTLEATRNFFHLYKEFEDLQNLADSINQGAIDDYKRDEVLSGLNQIVGDLFKNPNFKTFTSTERGAKQMALIQGILRGFNDGKLVSVKDTANLLIVMNNIDPEYVGDSAKQIERLLSKNKVNKSGSAAITEVRDNVRTVKEKFNEKYNELLTEVLWKQVPKNATIVRKGVSIPLTKEVLQAQLRMADVDTGTLDTWLSATISSRDPITAIAARVLKEVQYSTSMNVMSKRYQLQDAYLKANPKKEDAEKFHQKYIGEMKVLLKNEDGSLIEAQSDDPYVISPFDGKRYKVELRKRIRTATREDLRAIDNQLLRKELRALGINIQTVFETPRSKRKELFTQLVGPVNAERAMELLDISYQLKNGYGDSGAIQDDYIKLILQTYDEAQGMVGENARKLFHHEIPQVRKDQSFMERLNIKIREFKEDVIYNKEGNWFTRFMQWLLKSIETEQYISEEGTTARRAYLDGQEVYDIKLHFTSRMNPNEVLTDLFSSTLALYESANAYQGFSEMEPTLNALKTVLVGDSEMGLLSREVPQTKNGTPQYNGRLKQFLKKKLAVNVNQRLTEFINDVAYGEDNLDDLTFGLNGKVYSASKIASKFLGLASLQNIAFNWIAGMSNATTGNFNTISLSVGAKYFNFKDFVSAKKEVAKSLKDIMGDYAENDVRKKSKITQLMMFFDALQGEHVSLEGKALNQSTFQKVFSSNTLYFLNTGAEFEIQATGMVALLKATQVEGKSLWDLVKVTENGLEWDASVSPALRETTRNRIHALSKQLHGNYNKFDKSALQRRWYGRLAMMFRKYLYTSYRSRFGRRKYDFELEDETEGYYRRAWNTAGDMLKDLRMGGGFFSKLGEDLSTWQALGKTYREMDEDGKAAIRRTGFEMALFLSAMLLAYGVAQIELDDDDEVAAFMLSNLHLQLLRLEKDFGMYTPIIGFEDLMTVLRTPTVVIPSVDKIARLGFQLLPWNITETYDRGTGIAKKGDNKAWIMFLKAAPIVRQFINLLNAEEQIKFYTMVNRNAQ